MSRIAVQGRFGIWVVQLQGPGDLYMGVHDGPVPVMLDVDWNPTESGVIESILTPRVRPIVSCSMAGVLAEGRQRTNYQDAIDTVQRFMRERRP